MARDLWRWTRGLLATASWAFVMAGLLGMVEGLSQWMRFDVLSEGGPGFVRAVAPTVALYGWVAMLVAAVLYVPFHYLVRRRRHPRRHAYALSVATTLGLFVFFYAGYLFREHVATAWWVAHEQGAALLVQTVLMIVVAVLLTRPILALASRQVLSPWRNMFLAVVFVAVFTSLWPNWREEGRALRLAGVPAAAALDDGIVRPHLVLVTIDTWRRDALSALSPDAPPTPGLDALAAEGVLHTNYWSSSSWTLPAMATCLTGRAPRELGVAKYVGLPAGVPTLAQVASAHGYATAAFASNPYLTPAYGFDRGFGEFEHALMLEPLSPAGRSVLARELAYLADTRLDLDDASVVVGKAVRWLRQRRDERPLFLWLHLMDPHVPYRWRSLPADAPAPLRGTVPDRGAVPDHPLFVDGVFPGAHLPLLRAALPDVPEEVRAGVRALYAREIQYTDACLAEFWRSLRELGLWERSLIVVTSDHGEEFFEHGGFEHGHSLMPEVTGVPLLVRPPGGRPGGLRDDADRDALDLVPSLCRYLGWTPPPDLDGDDDLLAASADPATAAGEPSVMENMLYGEPQIAWRAWPYLAGAPETETPLAWFDLAADPGAQDTLAVDPAAAGGILDGARARLGRWDERAATLRAAGIDTVGPDADLRRQLRSLGY